MSQEPSKPISINVPILDSSSIPKDFSKPLKLYLIGSSVGLKTTADKANQSGTEAQLAIQKNIEQDEQLSNHTREILNIDAAAKFAVEMANKALSDVSAINIALSNQIADLSNRLTLLDERVKKLEDK